MTVRQYRVLRARGACFVVVVGTTTRVTSALRTATTTIPDSAATSSAFVFAGPRSLELLGPLLPWEPVWIDASRCTEQGRVVALL